MSQTILVNTEQVRSTGAEFLRRRGELEELVNRAVAQMQQLESQFKGVRAARIQQEWQGMVPSLRNSIQNLEQAGNLLNRAATDFESVDNAG
ncbi:MAG: WXG100 family type VII secretion target [Anaerolineales bacterium]|nr:WXG100 family type VII secretion target [Anaerolineales bacterium]